MKILYLTKGVVRKHGYYRDIELAKGLVKLGHDVEMIAASESWRGGIELIGGVVVRTFFDLSPYQVKKGGLSVLDVISRLYYLSNNKFDVVLVDSGFRPVTGIPGHLYAWLKNVPYICEWWDWIGKGGLYERKTTLYRFSLGLMDHYFESLDKKYSDGVSCLSESLRERAIGLGISPERTMVLHGGADLSLSSGKTKSEARNSLNIPQDVFLVGFAGMDGQEVMDVIPFLESIPALKNDVKHFRWFSTGGQMRDDFRQRFCIGDEYLEFGWVSYEQYRDCLAASDVLLLIQEDNLINTSRWPNKLGDYLAAGRPVLATRVGEIALFTNKYTEHGIQFVEWDKDKIRNTLINMSLSPGKMDEMGSLNQKIAHQDCSWEKKASDLSDFIIKIMSLGKK